MALLPDEGEAPQLLAHATNYSSANYRRYSEPTLIAYGYFANHISDTARGHRWSVSA